MNRKYISLSFFGLASALLLQTASLRAEEDNFGIPLHGFASGGWGYDNNKIGLGGTDDFDGKFRRGYTHGFYLDNVDLYLAKDVDSRVKFLTEIALEPDFEGQGIGIDTERLQIGYVFSNYLTVWVGRFHTPMGAYVIGYHHGAQLQTAIYKPRFLDFEDHWGVVPVHTTGLWLSGNTFVGDNRLGYMFWIGNGDRMTTENSGFTGLDMNMGHDDNHDITVGGRVTAFFSGDLDGLQIGLTAMRQRVDYYANPAAQKGLNAVTTTDPNSTAQNPAAVNPNTGTNFVSNFMMGGLHIDYENHGFEFLNEIYGFYNTSIRDTDQPTYKSWAGFSQLAYWFQGVTALFGRVERGNFDTKDPYFYGQTNGLPYTLLAGGLRYNLGDNSCVKAEYDYRKLTNGSPTVAEGAIHEIRTQYAIRF